MNGTPSQPRSGPATAPGKKLPPVRMGDRSDGVRTQKAHVEEKHKAEAKIRTYAQALADLLPRIAPLDLALRDAGLREPECRELRASISRRRRANMRSFAAELRETGRLRPDLTDELAADLVWSMNSPEYYQLLADAGYTPHQYANLLADTWTRTLLTKP